MFLENLTEKFSVWNFLDNSSNCGSFWEKNLRRSSQSFSRISDILGCLFQKIRYSPQKADNLFLGDSLLNVSGFLLQYNNSKKLNLKSVRFELMNSFIKKSQMMKRAGEKKFGQKFSITEIVKKIFQFDFLIYFFRKGYLSDKLVKKSDKVGQIRHFGKPWFYGKKSSNWVKWTWKKSSEKKNCCKEFLKDFETIFAKDPGSKIWKFFPKISEKKPRKYFNEFHVASDLPDKKFSSWRVQINIQVNSNKERKKKIANKGFQRFYWGSHPFQKIHFSFEFSNALFLKIQGEKNLRRIFRFLKNSFLFFL